MIDSMVTIARVSMDIALATIVIKSSFYQPDCPMNMEKGMLFYSVQVVARYIM